MSREEEIRREVSGLILAGIGLSGIAFFAPDAGHHFGAFVKVATSSVWQQPLEGAAAWCSLKMILLAGGLFLLIESLAKILAHLGLKVVAMVVFSTEIISILIFLTGGYYLLKALC